MTDLSPPSQQADADPFADFLSATPAAAAAPAGLEMFGTAPASAAPQTKTSTKDAIMALYGSSTNTAMPAGPYGMPSAGV